MNGLDIIELNKSHLNLIKNFESSNVELFDFLVEDAYNNQIINISKTYLAFKDNILVGYITLLNDSIKEREKGTIPMYLDLFRSD